MEVVKLFNILAKLEKKQIYFGPQGFDVISTADELKNAQQGYSTHPDGTKLSNSENGGWKISWLVFARDTELGDPYFIDISDDNLPVYTAFYGEGLWRTELVSSSLNGFIICMKLLSENGEQACAQFVPDAKTIINIEQLKQLSDNLIVASACQSFWQLFFQCYSDWLLEDDDNDQAL